MMHYFACLVEDEKYMSMMKKYFCKYKNIHVTYYQDSYLLIEQIDSIEAVFIDCQMTKMSYLSLLKAIEHSSCLKIIMTSDQCIPIESLAYHIFYYVRKYRMPDDFYICLKKIIEQLSFHQQQKLVLVSKKQMISLFYDDISYIETEKNYIIIHAYKKYKVRTTFKKILSLLQHDHFMTISYGMIVNIKYVTLIDLKRMIVMLDNHCIFTISQRYKKRVKEKYQYFFHVSL